MEFGFNTLSLLRDICLSTGIVIEWYHIFIYFVVNFMTSKTIIKLS